MTFKRIKVTRKHKVKEIKCGGSHEGVDCGKDLTTHRYVWASSISKKYYCDECYKRLYM